MYPMQNSGLYNAFFRGFLVVVMQNSDLMTFIPLQVRKDQ